MKKYSLKFEDINLEQQYQNEYNINIRYPLLLCQQVFLFISILFSIIMRIIDEDYEDLPIELGYLIFTGISIPITRRYKMLCQVYLFVFSQISCFITLWVSLCIYLIYKYFKKQCRNNQSNQYDYDFSVATFDISLQILLNYLIENIYKQPIKIEDYLYSFLSLLFFIYCRYIVEISNRTKFLLKLKDQEWNKLLANIVKKPFILFYFDEKQFSFELRTAGELSFSCLSSQELRQFLRNSKIGDQTLEQLIFREQKIRIENQLPLSNQQLNINFETISYKIELSGSYVQNYSYLILFDEDSQRIRSLTMNCIEQNKKIVEQIEKQQRNIFKILKKSLSLPNRQSIYFLKKFLVHHFQYYLMKQINKNRFKIQNLNLITIIYDIGILFNHKIKIDCSKCRQVNINSILSLIQFLLIDLFNKLKHQDILFYMKEEKDFITLNSIAEDSLYFVSSIQEIPEQFKSVINELIYFIIDEKIVGMQMLIFKEALLQINLDISNGVIRQSS